MEPERQQYYQYLDESEEADSFVVVDTNSDELRVTEKIDGEWCKPFWMPSFEYSGLETKKVGDLTSDQFLRVCQAAGITS